MFFLVSLFAACWSPSVRAAEIVSKKAILEIQPHAFEVGDYFSPAANQPMLDSCDK